MQDPEIQLNSDVFHKSSVSDLHWLYVDPDTDPDQAFWTNADPDFGKN
jgi:hypothetical protein